MTVRNIYFLIVGLKGVFIFLLNYAGVPVVKISWAYRPLLLLALLALLGKLLVLSAIFTAISLFLYVSPKIITKIMERYKRKFAKTKELRGEIIQCLEKIDESSDPGTTVVLYQRVSVLERQDPDWRLAIFVYWLIIVLVSSFFVFLIQRVIIPVILG